MCDYVASSDSYLIGRNKKVLSFLVFFVFIPYVFLFLKWL